MKKSQDKPQTVRGPDQRKKIEQSGEFGSQYRSENIGPDSVDNTVRHEKQTTQNRAINEHNSKK